MPTVLARLNEADYPQEGMWAIKAMISPEFVQEVSEAFGLVGDYEKISIELAKVLSRYQASALNALSPEPAPQAKELDRLEKAVSRALAAFENVSDLNKSAIDGEVMYRAPFNKRFFFKEQIDFGTKNKDSTQTAINKLAQISHAIKTLKTKRKADASSFKTTINTPLDHLIQDLSMGFERGTERKAKTYCYCDPKHERYAGQYLISLNLSSLGLRRAAIIVKSLWVSELCAHLAVLDHKDTQFPNVISTVL